MTTIIIIVVVALVFFVTVCVVTFMVWKREAEMRTDSIREIKDNLQRLEDRLTVETQPEEPTPLQDDLHEEVCRPVLRAADPAVAGRSRRSRSRSRDPFSWIRSEQEREETSQTEAQQPEEWPQPEPLQQTAEMSIMPDVSETPPQIIPEPEFYLQESRSLPQRMWQSLETGTMPWILISIFQTGMLQQKWRQTTSHRQTISHRWK